MSIEIYEYSNGCQTVAITNQSEIFSIGIFIKVGSRDEPLEKMGITHFIEHMLFKGTYNYSAKELAQAFDRIGGDINAYTTREYTVYYLTTLKRYAKQAITLLGDMMLNSQLTEADINKEKKVILEELKMTEDSVEELLLDQSQALIYPEQSLGYNILGTVETINSFTRQDLVTFMSQFYHAKNMTIALCGDYNDEILTHLENIFGHQMSDNQLSHQETSVFTPGQHVIHKKEIEQSHLLLSWNGLAVNDSRYYAMELFNIIYGDAVSSRLFQVIREEHGLVYTINSSHDYSRQEGILSVYAACDEQNMPQVIQHILTINQDLISHGITDDELRDAKVQLLTHHYISQESSKGKMMDYGREYMYCGDIILTTAWERAIENTTVQDINYLISEILTQPYSQVHLKK